MFWMTTLLGMLLIGSLEMTGANPDPEDDGTDPGEPKTADLPGQDQCTDPPLIRTDLH